MAALPELLEDEATRGAALPPFWDGARRLLDRHGGRRKNLAVHGLDLLAAWRLEELGREVPEELKAAVWASRAMALTAPTMLRRIRDAYDGQIVLMKGPELAALYPAGARRFSDVDLLVRDPAELQQALLNAGFVEVDDPDLFVDIHHLRPLRWPTMPLKVELHSAPKWPHDAIAPCTDEVMEAAVPAAVGVEGIHAPTRVHHTLIVTAHGWGHRPLRAVRDLLDARALAEGVDRGELFAVARRWGLERIARATLGAADALLDDRKTFALRTWARHLPEVRERTVLESHLELLLSPFAEWGPAVGLVHSLDATRLALSPAVGESWGAKLRRTGTALRDASRPRSQHDRELGDAAKQRRGPRRSDPPNRR